jgi:hypothetical protein
MPVIGSREALEGYDIAASGAILADDVPGFMAALKTLELPGELRIRGKKARDYFERSLSYPAVSVMLFKALGALGFMAKKRN